MHFTRSESFLFVFEMLFISVYRRMKIINHVIRPAPNVSNLLSVKRRFLAREFIADFCEIGWCNVFFLI